MFLQELRAAQERVDAGIAEGRRLRKLLARTEEGLAADRATVAEHELRIASIREEQRPVEDRLETALAAARRVMQDELQAIAHALTDALR